MVKKRWFIIGLILFGGCSSSGRMERLLTLKELAAEQNKISRHIEEQDQKFEQLWEAIEGGVLTSEETQQSIATSFGEPIYKKKVVYQGQPREEWLYRYATQFFDSKKVYLYFNDEYRLMDWIQQGGHDEQSWEKTTEEAGF